MEKGLRKDRGKVGLWRYIGVCPSLFGNLARRRYYLIYSIAFCLAALVALCPIILNGRSLTIYYDGLEQHYTWFVYEGRWLREIISNLISGVIPIVPEWTFDLGYGADIITSASNWIGDPLNLLSAFCPEKWSGYLFSALWVARCWLAGVTFSFYCRRNEKQQWATLAGAIVYCLGGFSMTAFVHPNFFNPLILFPLVLAGADDLFEGRSPVLFIVASFLSFASWFYFAYMICLLLLSYCVVKYFANVRPNRGVKDFGLLVLKFGACLILAAAMAAFLLVPIVSAQLGASRLSVAHEVPYLYLESNGLPLYYLNFLGAFASYGQISIDSAIGFGAAGALCCLVLILVDRSPERKVWRIWFVMLTIFGLLPVFGWVFNGFSYVSNRWVFGYAFCVCYVIADILPDLPQLVSKKRGSILVIAIGFSILLIMLPQTRTVSFAVSVACIFAMLMVVAYQAELSDKRLRFLLLSISIFCPIFCCFTLFSIGFGNASYDRVPQSALYSNVFETSYARLADQVEADESRIDSNHIRKPVNSSMLLGIHSVDFYDNLYNNNVAQFHTKLGLVPSYYKEEYRYTDLDARSALEAIAGVQWVVIPENNTALLPYDAAAEPEATISGDAIYELPWTLGMAYTYKSAMADSEWEELSSLEKQEALLTHCVVANSPSVLSKKRVSNSQSVKFTVEASDGVEYDGETAEVTKAGATLTLHFDGISDSETYLQIQDLDFDEMGAVEAVGNSFSQLTRYDKNTLILRDLTTSHWYGSGYWDATSFDLGFSSRPYGEWTEERFWTVGSSFYTGETEWLLNCGYSEEEQHAIRISFPKVGCYSMSLAVFCQPMDDFDKRVAALAEDPVEDLELSTNSISGSVTCSGDRLIYISVPWAEGWTATLDGEPVEVKRANVAFMAIEAGGGVHEFSLQYSNPKTKLGLAISAVAWIVFVGVILRCRRNAAKRAHEEGTEKRLQQG